MSKNGNGSGPETQRRPTLASQIDPSDPEQVRAVLEQLAAQNELLAAQGQESIESHARIGVAIDAIRNESREDRALMMAALSRIERKTDEAVAQGQLAISLHAETRLKLDALDRYAMAEANETAADIKSLRAEGQKQGEVTLELTKKLRALQSRNTARDSADSIARISMEKRAEDLTRRVETVEAAQQRLSAAQLSEAQEIIREDRASRHDLEKEARKALRKQSDQRWKLKWWLVAAVVLTALSIGAAIVKAKFGVEVSTPPVPALPVGK